MSKLYSNAGLCSPTILRFSVFFLVFICLTTSGTFAANFTVNQGGDAGDGTCDATCTLRDAVLAANAAASNDTISFAAGITNITLVNNEIQINNSGTLSINGTGANILTIDGGAGTNRIFYTNLATVTISGVTLTGGNGTGATASGSGGAIYANGGMLVLDGVFVSANTVTPQFTDGGGVYFNGGSNHQIINSTFSGNSTNLSGNCGGFFNNGGTLTVINTTISGNTAIPTGNGGGLGGGFCSNGNTTLQNVTVSSNSGGNGSGNPGSGIYHYGGTLNLTNSIVAGNAASNPDILFRNDINPSAAITTSGYNIIGDNTSVAATFPAGNPNANNDIVGTTAAPINPLLGPLQDNGGTTPTRALLFGSPALDKGNSTLTTDQRGFTRPVDLPSIANATGGNGADIGAFEAQTAPAAPTAATVSISGQVTTPSGRGIRGIILSLTDFEGNIRSATTTAFGYYQFADIQVGSTYILSASGKHYTFSQPVQVLNVDQENNQIDFIANSEKRERAF